MTKPIERPEIDGGVCQHCYFNSFYEFFCNLKYIKPCDEPCTPEDWERCPFNPANQEPKTQPPKSSYLDDIKNLEFDSRGKFYHGCQHYFKKLKKDVDPIISDLDLDETSQRKRAWLRLVDKYGGQPERAG